MEFILIFEVIFPFCNPMLNNLYGKNFSGARSFPLRAHTL